MANDAPSFAGDDAVAMVTIPPAALPAPDRATLAERARRGALSEADARALAAVTPDAVDYTSSRLLLLQDARVRDDRVGRKLRLAELMAIPENRYRPELLTEEALVSVEERNWAKAVDRANAAEQHWARLPSEMVFSYKALIHELQAAGYTGRFFASDGEDTESLDAALAAWRKYRTHVNAHGRADLASRADEATVHLTGIQQRLGLP